MKRRSWLAVVVVAGLAGSVYADQPPAAETLANTASEFSAWARSEGRDATAEQRRATADERLAGLDLAGLDVEGLRTIAAVIDASSQRAAVQTRMVELSRQPDLEGVLAAVLAVDLLDGESSTAAERAESLRRVLAHPALASLYREKAPVATGFTWTLAEVTLHDQDVLKVIRPELARLGQVIEPGASRDVVAGAAICVRALAEAGPAGAPDLEKLRTRLTDLAEAGRDQADEKTRVRWERLVRLLKSPSMYGPIAGSKATPLTIEWSSDPTIRSFEDLRGKVVVLDFWATWCGPCNASFPDVRKLTAHYEGYPVVVVGVTSIQGRHIGPDGPITTDGNPDKERALMNEFIERKNLTWPVVFTAEAAHNPDYGVIGIPHVTIIDPDGVVRYNGLSPFEPLTAKAEKIDAVLREFKLPVPIKSAG